MLNVPLEGGEKISCLPFQTSATLKMSIKLLLGQTIKEHVAG